MTGTSMLQPSLVQGDPVLSLNLLHCSVFFSGIKRRSASPLFKLPSSMGWSSPFSSSSSWFSCSPLCSGSTGGTASGCSTSTSQNARSGETSRCTWRRRSRRRDGWRERGRTGRERGWGPDRGRRGRRGRMARCPFWCSALSISLVSQGDKWWKVTERE